MIDGGERPPVKSPFRTPEARRELKEAKRAARKSAAEAARIQRAKKVLGLNTPTGRPPAPIDEEGVRKLAARFWTTEEIAAFYNVTRNVIYNRGFAKIIAEGRAQGRARLRELQWAAAEEGSEKVLIHMSQQHLEEHPQQHMKIENVPTESLLKVVEARLLEDEQARQRLTEGEGTTEAEGTDAEASDPNTKKP
jgi:hypothetical protein